MKIKTQIIDKIEDVQGDDIVIDESGENFLAWLVNGDCIETDDGSIIDFNECTVVRITVEEE